MRLRISLQSVSKALSTASTGQARAPFPIAVQELASFLRDNSPNIAVLTGAGVSTDSAIPDYRGQNGTYTLNPDYKPVFYQAFVASDEARHRYWARSFLGFPPVLTTDPNPTHYALAAFQSPSQAQLQSLASSTASSSPLLDSSPTQGPASPQSNSYIRTLITQNVDGLHQKAGTKDVIELHGSLYRVKCMACGHEKDRAEFQRILADLNPDWNDLIQSQTATNLYARMNADGDVEINTPDQQKLLSSYSSSHKLDYRTFQYPTCSCCRTGDYKPSVVFFGENVPADVRNRSLQTIQGANGLLVIGSSLATFSAYRLVKLAKDTGIPIAMINLGQSRGDSLADLRYDESSTQLLKAVAHELGLGEIQGAIKRRKRTLNVVGS
ncbi:DHS-like NAD/FAD-binding domain-containing protein [Gamsiella multidivaricata]|uniref:DHS-like NAD/FAD-binding domain-containing protein n=1 Tax=Gamsiella multidivaricata TaxID=101098 RepID=UPI00221F53EE|nr:DHS-like NAD/FAD-binding domain-containing protein [Gamsiella multidivaricata]KAG0370397.1 NAD-dependent protein lipoamidase sirtuin-4 [Gamsiella multidivaricata]KAI7818235.1 DHS-like NAD/FAD-binding domain-containing protein [Gamsiella multidivaricata]